MGCCGSRPVRLADGERTDERAGLLANASRDSLLPVPNEHKSHQGIPKDPGYAKRLNSIVQETAEQLIDIHRQQEQLTAQEIQERSKEYKQLLRQKSKVKRIVKAPDAVAETDNKSISNIDVELRT